MPNVYRQKALIKKYENMGLPRNTRYLSTNRLCAKYYGVSIIIDRPGKVHGMRKNLRFAAVCTHAAAKRSARRYFELKRRNKKGEPMYKRFGLWRMVIYPSDIVKLLGIRIRTAQEMLQNTRFLLGVPPRSYVALNDFCRINDMNVDFVRETLNKHDELDKILMDKRKEIEEQKRLEEQKEKEEKKKAGIITEGEEDDEEKNKCEEEEKEDEVEKANKLKKYKEAKRKWERREKRASKMKRKKNSNKRVSLKKMTIRKKGER